MKYRFSSRAADDLKLIIDYISDRNPRAADRLLDRFEQRWMRLCDYPASGSPREELGVGIRQVIAGEYLSIYRLEDDEILILRVLHGKRNVTAEDVADG